MALGQDHVAFGIHTDIDETTTTAFAHYAPLHDAATSIEAADVVEKQLYGDPPSRRFEIFRHYWPSVADAENYSGSTWVKIKDRAKSGNGSVPLLSLRTNGDNANDFLDWSTWNDSNTALKTRVDQIVSNIATFISTYNLDFYVAFMAECYDDSTGKWEYENTVADRHVYGTPEEYRKASMWFSDRIRANAGAARCRRVFCQTAYHIAFVPAGSVADPDLYYPGKPFEADKYIDFIAYDEYMTTPSTANWQTFKESVEYTRNGTPLTYRNGRNPRVWAQGKPNIQGWGVWETSCQENTDPSPPVTATKPYWINNIVDDIKTWNNDAIANGKPLFQHFAWFHKYKLSAGEPDYYFDTTTASRDAFKALANDPYMGGNPVSQPLAKLADFNTGFEAGAKFAALFTTVTTAGSSTLTATSGAARNGNFGAAFASNGGVCNVRQNITAGSLSDTGFAIRFAARFVTLPASSVNIVEIYDDIGFDWDIKYDSSTGKWAAVIPAATPVQCGAGQAPVANTWQVFEMRVKTDAAADQRILDWRIDGVDQTRVVNSASVINGAPTWSHVMLGLMTSVTRTLHMDDVCWVKSFAAYPLGDGKGVALYPSSTDITHGGTTAGSAPTSSGGDKFTGLPLQMFPMETPQLQKDPQTYGLTAPGAGDSLPVLRDAADFGGCEAIRRVTAAVRAPRAASTRAGKLYVGGGFEWVADVGDNPGDSEPTGSTMTTANVYGIGDGAVVGTKTNSNAVAANVPLPGSGNLDMFMYLGDVYLDGTASEFTANYDSVYGATGRNLISKTAAVVGNHEYQIGSGETSADPAAGFRTYWTGKTSLIGDVNPANGGGAYYTQTIGDYKFIFIDTASGSGSSLVTGGTQYTWLSTELGNAPTKKKIIVSHIPRWSADASHKDNPNLDEVWKLIVDGGAILWIAGHAHTLQRMVKRNRLGRKVTGTGAGCVQLVIGAGGQSRYDMQNTYNIEEAGTLATVAGLAYSSPALGALGSTGVNGYLKLILTSSSVTCEIRNASGTLLDTSTITHATAPSSSSLQQRMHVFSMDMATGGLDSWKCDVGSNLTKQPTAGNQSDQTSFGTGASAAFAVRDLAITKTGQHLFIGGKFDRITNGAGSTTTGYDALACYDVGTQECVTGWKPNPDHVVLCMAMDQESKRLYVGGAFSTMDATSHSKVAAFDVTTPTAPTLLAWDAGAINGEVLDMALSPDGRYLYLGGKFTTVNGLTRNYLAQLEVKDTTGALRAQPILTSFSPQWAGNPGLVGRVEALDLSADGEYVFAGGDAGDNGVWKYRVGPNWQNNSIWRGLTSGDTGNIQAACANDAYGWFGHHGMKDSTDIEKGHYGMRLSDGAHTANTTNTQRTPLPKTAWDFGLGIWEPRTEGGAAQPMAGTIRGVWCLEAVHDALVVGGSMLTPRSGLAVYPAAVPTTGTDNFDKGGTAIDTTAHTNVDDTDFAALDGAAIRQITAAPTGYIEMGFDNLAAGLDVINAVRGWVAVSASTTGANDGATKVIDGAQETVIYAGDANGTTGQTKTKQILPTGPVWDRQEVRDLVSRVGYSTDSNPNYRWEAVLLEVDATINGAQAGGTVHNITADLGVLNFGITPQDRMIFGLEADLSVLQLEPRATPDGSPPVVPQGTPTFLRRGPGIGPLVHQFVTRNGSVITSYLEDFECSQEVNAGFVGANGQGLRRPDLIEQGGDWRVIHAETGEVIWAGSVLPRGYTAGLTELTGEGWSTLAERQFTRYLLETRDMTEWESQEGLCRLTAGGQRFELGMGKGKISWKGDKGTEFGADDTAGFIFWAPETEILRVGFKYEHATAWGNGFRLEVLKGTGPGNCNSMSDSNVTGDYPSDGGNAEGWVLGPPGAGDTRANDGSHYTVKIPGANDQIWIRIRSLGAIGSPGITNDVSAILTELFVNAADGNRDDIGCGEVATDIAAKLGMAAEVESDQIQVLPLDFKEGAYSEVLDWISMLADFRWRIIDVGNGPLLQFGSWDQRTWMLRDPENEVQLQPLERFNAVRVPFKYSNSSATGAAEVVATPLVLPDLNYFTDMSVEGPLPNKDQAENLGNSALDYLIQQRYSGSVRLISAIDMGTGAEWSAHHIRAGDQMYLPHQGGITLRIKTVRHTPDSVTVEFDDGFAALDKLISRRQHRLQQRGRYA